MTARFALPGNPAAILPRKTGELRPVVLRPILSVWYALNGSLRHYRQLTDKSLGCGEKFFWLWWGDLLNARNSGATNAAIAHRPSAP